MTVESQMPELDRGGFFAPPPYKTGSQNTPYKLGLKLVTSCEMDYRVSQKSIGV